jgi:misacylated tRNA(Ala) deacylase
MDDRMTARLFLDDPTLATTPAIVVASGSDAIVLDRTVFYPRGGGQPGDTGSLRWDGGETPIVEAVKGDGDAIFHPPEPDVALPPIGAVVEAAIDWQRPTLTCVCTQRCTCCAA